LPDDNKWGRKVKIISNFFKNEDGATAIEYGLIAALIAVAAITAMSSLGNNLSNTFNSASNKLENRKKV
jgi:pilus assembly protein Flp/PilA